MARVLGIYFFLRDLPAERMAAAIACFCGRPLRIISLMFWLMTFLLDPFLSGMA